VCVCVSRNFSALGRLQYCSYYLQLHFKLFKN